MRFLPGGGHHDGSAQRETGNCPVVRRGWPGGVGGGIGPPAGQGTGTVRFAVRVLRAGVDGGLAGPGRAGAAAGAGGGAVRGHGIIVAEFFDAGQSRTVAWGRRPEAAALLALLADPDRGWDAIVVGEYERAFYGSQYAAMAPLFEHYGVQLWMPEAAGQVDFASEHDEQACGAGVVVEREVTRTSSGADRDGGPGAGAGPVSGRAPAVRVPAGSCRAAPGPTHPGAAAPTAWNPTRRPRMSSGGSSPGGWQAIRRRGSRGR